MANLSQKKRQRMLSFLNQLKAQNRNDDETLMAINEIENALNEKKYGLVWERHEEAVDVKMRTHIPVFTEDQDKEITVAPGEPYNFLLEGDNLHSLKLLEKTHRGKIDVIYIDPPYNTMKDGFTYSDQTVDGNDMFRHSKWISFMHRRLIVIKRLMSDKGIIFISVDENEYAQLKLLCDEIFTESCFVENIVWNKRVPKNDKGIGNIHEYILTYTSNPTYKYKLMSPKEGITKIKNLILEEKSKGSSLAETEKKLKALYKKENYPRAITLYNNLDNNYHVFGKINMSWPNGNTFGPRYEVKHPITGNPVKVPDRGWRWSKATFDKVVDYENPQILPDGSMICGKIWFSSKDEIQPSSINYLDKVDRMLLRSIISLKSDGGMMLESLFNKKSAFAYPKPVTLIKMLIDACTYNDKDKNLTILDFFAGSGTTAQAVLELNQEDGGHRQFILCTNNENHICEDVTYPRVKTVITGMRQDDSQYSDGIPANLKYYRTDFVSKDEEFLSDALLSHIAEMIQLEHGVKLDGKQYIMVLSDEDADRLAKNWQDYPDVKALYISSDVLLTAEQNNLFQHVATYIIPNHYFDFELKEVGELW